MVHMPPSLGQVHKLVSSSRIDKLLALSHFKYLAPWVKTVRLFSSVDDSIGSVKQPVGETDGLFLQQSDPSFNHNVSHRSQEGEGEGYNFQQCSSELIPSSRPLRGGKPINQRPQDFHEYNRGSHPSPPRIEDNHGGSGESGKMNKYSQIEPGFRGRNVAETSRGVSQLGDSFLDKFKLDYDNKTVKPSEVAASSQYEESKRSTRSQPAPESQPQEADEIFKKMKETGLIPSAVAMLDGLCKDGLVQEALKLFGLMREKGTIPEIVIYTAVVEGYAKAHKPDDAKRTFRKMQSNGILPNAYSYTVLIQGLYKCGRLQDAFEFCLEMLEASHSPNVTTFVGLIDGFCKEKGVEEAKGAIRTLIEKGFTINEKAVREFLDKKAPFSPSVWEAIFGKKFPPRPF